jgi:hypothetical protein
VTESEIDVAEVKAKLDRGDHFVPIDVREPHEYKIFHIPAARLIPLGEVPKRLNGFDPQSDIVIHCRSGVRSAKVDPNVPKYRSLGGGRSQAAETGPGGFPDGGAIAE